MNEQDTRSEEHPFTSDTLIAKLRELIHAGNIRRVIIKNEEGRVLVDIPLTVGVVGTLLAPQFAAIGAIAVRHTGRHARTMFRLLKAINANSAAAGREVMPATVSGRRTSSPPWSNAS